MKSKAMGVGSLPFPSEDIVFVKTTMAEEGYSAAYTHKTEIYVGEKLLKLAESNPSGFYKTIAHEMFHCLTRNSPSFRSRMYSLIGFTVTGTDYVFSPAIGKMIITNPEECLADNFAFAVVYGIDGREYKTPQLIADIIALLKEYR